MEEVHGVDVSWLHHNQREHDKLKRPSSTKHTPSSTGTSTPTNVPLSAHDTTAANGSGSISSSTDGKSQQQQQQHSSLTSLTQVPPTTQAPPLTKRRSLLRKSSSEKMGTSPEEKTPKRSSWMSSLSSKFSSSSTQVPSVSNTAQQQESSFTAPPHTANLASSFRTEEDGDKEGSGLSQSPGKSSGASFLSSALRKFSSGAPAASPKMATSGTIAPRRLLNIDKGRDRCKLRELDASRLKRVAFCVDVEIAGATYYSDDDDDDSPPVGNVQKEKDKKMMQRSEGEALKHPEAVAAAKEEPDQTTNETPSFASDFLPIPGTTNKERHDSFNSTTSNDSVDDTDWDMSLWSSASRRPSRENKLDPEAHARRKAVKEERKRRKALAAAAGNPVSPSTPTPSPHVSGNPQQRPTTDPVRMYRRCCQLRESPVLKRISEQLSKPDVCGLEAETNTIGCLDLRGSRMQLPDIMCLGDWLAIVPVRQLLLDNANLTNEGLRCILAGLLAAKSSDQSRKRRGRSSPTKAFESRVRRSSGVIERISLRNNPKISQAGWEDLCTFVNMCKSLTAIDVSLIPIPQSEPAATNGVESGGDSDTSSSVKPKCIGMLLGKALLARPSDAQLEELIVGDCNLQTHHVQEILKGVTRCKLRRLGLARNRLTHQGFQAVADYLRTGQCWGLDVGGNDVTEVTPMLAEAITAPANNNLWALSLARCNLTVKGLAPLLPALAALNNFRFLDLSHNQELFSAKPNAVCLLRKELPRLKWIRRIHLLDVGLSTEQAIALAEVIPEMRNLNHINLNENEQLRTLALQSDSTSQEDACALYGSLMVAAKVSKTLFAVDLEVPGPASNDVVKALNKQIVVYCLRNMDRYIACNAMKLEDPASAIPDEQPDKGVELPNVLVNLVGPDVEGNKTPMLDDSTILPGQDYVIGGTGIVKALNYVLGQQAADGSMNESGSQSPFTPTSAQAAVAEAIGGKSKAKAKELSLNLLANARQVRARLQPALVREAQQGNEWDYRRLQFLEHTVQGMIERFEEEFPDCRQSFEAKHDPVAPANTSFLEEKTMTAPDNAEEIIDEAALFGDRDEPSWPPPAPPSSADGFSRTVHNMPSSRRASETSLAGRALAQEEGKMHRFGQTMRRSVLPPRGMDDYLHGTTTDDQPDPEHIARIRRRLENLDGDVIRDQVVHQGLEATVKLYSDDKSDLFKSGNSPPQAEHRPTASR